MPITDMIGQEINKDDLVLAQISISYQDCGKRTISSHAIGRVLDVMPASGTTVALVRFEVVWLRETDFTVQFMKHQGGAKIKKQLAHFSVFKVNEKDIKKYLRNS